MGACATLAFAGMISIFGMSAAHAADITVISSTAMRELLDELIPAFEQASGHKVTLDFQSGVNVSAKLRGGAKADLVVTTGTALDELIKDEKVVAGSRIDFVRSRVGVAVRAGAPKPDISTPEGFKSALLAAKTIGVSKGPSGQHLMTVIEKLGIADQVKPKMVLPELGVRVGTLVARGDAEIGVQQVNELLPIAGIDFVGPLPEIIQPLLIYSTGLVATGTQHEAAKDLVKFLTSDAAIPVMKKLGLDLAREART